MRYFLFIRKASYSAKIAKSHYLMIFKAKHVHFVQMKPNVAKHKHFVQNRLKRLICCHFFHILNCDWNNNGKKFLFAKTRYSRTSLTRTWWLVYPAWLELVLGPLWSHIRDFYGQISAVIVSWCYFHFLFLVTGGHWLKRIKNDPSKIWI